MGFQTNLTFPEQRRVFRMIPGLENAEFARYGVMHRNTFINAPQLLTPLLQLRSTVDAEVPVFVAGQLAGTEGTAKPSARVCTWRFPLRRACAASMRRSCPRKRRSVRL